MDSTALNTDGIFIKEFIILGYDFLNISTRLLNKSKGYLTCFPFF